MEVLRQHRTPLAESDDEQERREEQQKNALQTIAAFRRHRENLGPMHAESL